MSVYRSSHEVLVARRRAELVLLHELAAPALPRVWGAVAARAARIAAGVVGLVGAGLVAIRACGDDHRATTYALLGTVAAAAGVYVGGRLLGALVVATRAHPVPPVLTLPGFSGDPDADLSRLEACHPLAAPTRWLTRLGRASLAIPLVALSLLGPLTLHFPVAATLGVPAREFGEWITISAAVVGLAHVVLAALSVRYANRLLRATEAGEPLSFPREWGSAFGITVGASCVPGLVLLAIPPLLTAITGLVLVPAMFAWARACVQDEALALGAAQIACAEAARDDSPAGAE